MKAPLLVALCIGLAASLATAAPPGIINHQGRIAVNGANYGSPAPQTGHFKFALTDASGTTVYWSNSPDTAPADGEPDEAVSVTVTNGHYSVALGDATLGNMAGAIPAALFEANDEVYLCTWFSPDPPGTFEALLPKRRILSNAYALHAATASGVTDGGVTAAMLAAGSVTSDKFAPGAVHALGSPDGSLPGLVTTDDGGAVLFSDTTIDPIEIHDPRATAETGGGGDLAVANGFVYLASTDSSFRIYEVVDPDTIKTRGVFTAPFFSPVAVAVDGNLAYVLSRVFSNDLHVLDVSDPDNIVTRDVISVGGAAGDFLDLAVAGTTVWVARSGAGFGNILAFDASDPDKVSAIGGSDIPINSRAVDVAGRFLYAFADPLLGSTEFRIYDAGTPSAPILLDSDSTGLSVPRGLAISNGLAFVLDDGTNRLQLFDVSAPLSIMAKDFDSTGLSNPTSVTVVGDVAVVADSGSNRLHTFDVSSPNAIVPLETYGGIVDPVSIDNSGGFLYVADADPTSPRFHILKRGSVRASIDGGLHLTDQLFDRSASPGIAGQVLSSTGSGTAWTSLAHGDLEDLGEDDHLQYALLGGRSAGQTLFGGTDPSGDLTLESTSNATKGNIILNGDVQVTGTINATTFNGMLAAGSVESSEILDGTIVADDLATDSVGADEIAAGAVGGSEILNNSITAADLNSGIGIWTAVASDIHFGAGGAGDVGIGGIPSADLHVVRSDNDVAEIYATGSSQGSGIIYAGQSTSYGGGFGYDGDETPDIVGGADRITFFRRSAGADSEVFSYHYNSDDVTFAGRLGIGTSPSYQLEVASGDSLLNGDLFLGPAAFLDDDTTPGGDSDDWIRFNGYFEIKSNTDSYGIVLRDKDSVAYSGFTNVDGVTYLADGNASGNYFLSGDGRDATFGGRVEIPATFDADGTAGTGVFEIADSLRIDGDEIITNSGTTLYLQFGNGGDLSVDSNTLYVDSSTNEVGIGTSDPDAALEVQDFSSLRVMRIENLSTSPAAGGLEIEIGPPSNPGTSNDFIRFLDGDGDIVGTIDGDGAGGIRYNTTSDARLKQDVADMRGALKRLEELRPRAYSYKTRPDLRVEGFLAQEVAEVYPQAVGGDPNGDVRTDPMVIDYSTFTPLLAGGIKELHQLVTEENKQLRAENNALRERLERLEAAVHSLTTINR